MSYAEFGLLVLLAGGAFALLAWFADRRLDAPVESVRRGGRRIPEDERRLLGDDYRECVKDFSVESFIRYTRKRFAIYLVTGADPFQENDEPRAAGPAEAQTHMEVTHASAR